jgi:predicted NUDIX family NTP pyrophosphohydrolase
MPKQSAGLLMFRRRAGELEVFLVHPGGPFWAKKDAGAWSIPKGEYGEGEEPLAAARREFAEERGFAVPSVEEDGFVALGSVKQAGGKVVMAWGFEGDCDPAALVSNLCSIEWPPRSGRLQEFPEADRGAWFPLAKAREKILKGQIVFLERLTEWWEGSAANQAGISI